MSNLITDQSTQVMEKDVLELTAGIGCLNLLAMTNYDDYEIAEVAYPLENTVLSLTDRELQILPCSCKLEKQKSKEFLSISNNDTYLVMIVIRNHDEPDATKISHSLKT